MGGTLRAKASQLLGFLDTDEGTGAGTLACFLLTDDPML